MNSNGWGHSVSPFHPGELALQARLGVQDQIDRQGRRMIRDFLPEQHQQFFAQLPYVLIGTVDRLGQPWASILVGKPGFIQSLSDRLLQISAQPLAGDPLAQTLQVGSDVGILGIELATRRRNRVNGTILQINDDGFTVQVGQSFGNCPQYIQARQVEVNAIALTLLSTTPVILIDRFGPAEQQLITGADTFFIATAYQATTVGVAGGVDVSHRGGKPGFVRIDDDRTLTIPDFSGNRHFNTLGNLELNPKAGLLFIDFQQGDLLYLTGQATVIWESDEIQTYAGAERLLRFQLEQGYRLVRSLPLRWSEPAFSPFLISIGSWS